GEPLLIPVSFYDEIAQLQKAAFGDDISYSNSAQSNLTVLTERQIEWLKNKTLLQSLGISFDVFGDQRVDKLGRTRTQTIAANMQKLVDNDIDLGAIAVLSRSTLAHVRQIYEFYDSLRVGVRFLPFYMSADAAQVQVHELSYAEIVAALNS